MIGLRTNIVPAAATTALLAAVCFVPNVAYAATVDQLNAAYVNALHGYEDALDEQAQNADQIAETERNIAETEKLSSQAQGELNETAVALYKDTRSKNVLVDLLLNSESFTEAVTRYELYEKVEGKCVERIQELARKRDELNTKKISLEAEKAKIQVKVEQAFKEAKAAETALMKAKHADGDKYQQVQGNGSNCGATAFTVGLNILLGEERYKDNVKVWSGPGFNGDSTNALAARAQKWLSANKLDDVIDVEEVKGDIHKAEELKKYLQEGKVVVISSGSGSLWRYADKPSKGLHKYADGHWVVFYYYEEGKDGKEGTFYCNDSGVPTNQGAGCPYTDSQMQDWLDGRGNHFATVMSTK